MKIGFVADVHLGVNALGSKVVAGISEHTQLRLRALEAAVSKAVMEGCERLYVAGDLFDSAKPTPQLIAEAQRVLCSFLLGERDLPSVHVLLGNHDSVSSLDGDHALGPLHRAGIDVIDRPRFHAFPVGSCVLRAGPLVLEVPFVPGKPAREWLPEALDRFGGNSFPYILVTHVGIYDEGVLKAMHIPEDAAESMSGAIPVDMLRDLMRKHNINLTLAGDWHSRRWWTVDGKEMRYINAVSRGYRTDGGLICQIGALAPTDFGDKPPYGSLLIYDSAAAHVEIHEIPGPRFFQTDSLAR